MPSTPRLVHAASVLALLLAAGCERGCLSRGLADRSDANPLPLDQVDCPDGLARCVDGRLEHSKLASVDPRKPGGCPWEALVLSAPDQAPLMPPAICAGGCVENVSVPEARARQLCREADGGVPWLGLTGASVGTERCPTEGRWACVAARVVDCPRGVAVATCLRGCALEELEDEVSEGDAKVILCAH